MDNLQVQSGTMSVTQNISTYDFLMTQNVMSKFNINLSNEEIKRVIQEKKGLYYLLMSVPIENIYNQIIFSQIKSYELFIQKRMIDYVIGTAPTSTAIQNAEGADVVYPEAFVNLQERFKTIQAQLLELDNQILKKIAETHQYIKKYVMKNISKGVQLDDEVSQEFNEKIKEFLDDALELRTVLIAKRDEWKSFAAQVCKLLSELGGYYIEEEVDLAQRSEINFFRGLGFDNHEKNAI